MLFRAKWLDVVSNVTLQLMAFLQKQQEAKCKIHRQSPRSIVRMDELVGVIIQSHVRQLEAMQDANM